jgi:hypothetical protein
MIVKPKILSARSYSICIGVVLCRFEAFPPSLPQSPRPHSDRMDIEHRLRKLESEYRAVLSSAVAAKARYLSLEGEAGTTAAAVERSKSAWQRLELRRALLAAKMMELERLEHDAVA